MNHPPLGSGLRRAWRARRRVSGSALYWSGLTFGYRHLAQSSGAVVLMYHSVADETDAQFIDPANRMTPAQFERQMVFLAHHRHVISLEDLVKQVVAGQSPRHGTVCITFDDGYLDNLTIAAPILLRLRLPATLFLPTGYVEHALPQWVDSIHCSFRFRTRHQLDLRTLDMKADLRDRHGERRARALLHSRLLESRYPERQVLLDELAEQLRPAAVVPKLTMDWEGVRSLQRVFGGFDIGGHTRHHVDLRTHAGELAREEILGCAEDIKRAIGQTPRYFSFPYGRWSEESRALVEDSPWEAAIGASSDTRITSKSDRYVLARPETPSTMTALRSLTV